MTQDYAKYTTDDRYVWQTLFDRQMKILPGKASKDYLEGIEKIKFDRNTIPNFEETNQLLKSITGWQLAVVKGLIDNKPFFELLENKYFPASTWFRKRAQLEYLEEPDMFHDVFGHVPLLTNQHFCDFLKGLSKIALKFIDNAYAIELISRLYWYTVEFGLIQDNEGLRIYGAGILSSSGESVYCLGDAPTRVPFNVKEIMETPYIKDKFQEKYWVISNYEQLFKSVPEVEATLMELLVPNH